MAAVEAAVARGEPLYIVINSDYGLLIKICDEEVNIMAANNLVVTPEELDTAANSIRTYADKYRASWTAVFNEFIKIDTAWDGDDNTVFNEKVASFRHDFEAMNNFFDSLQTFLKGAATEYRNRQAEVKANASKLKK